MDACPVIVEQAVDAFILPQCVNGFLYIGGGVEYDVILPVKVGQDKDAMPCVCRINYYSRNLIVVEGKHYFRTTASIRSSGFSAQPGLDVFARIVVSDKTLWQQVFR